MHTLAPPTTGSGLRGEREGVTPQALPVPSLCVRVRGSSRAGTEVSLSKVPPTRMPGQQTRVVKYGVQIGASGTCGICFIDQF